MCPAEFASCSSISNCGACKAEANCGWHFPQVPLDDDNGNIAICSATQDDDDMVEASCTAGVSHTSQLIQNQTALCELYHFTTKPYWVTTLHVFFMNFLLSYVVLGGKTAGWANQTPSRKTTAIMYYQICTAWVQYISIFRSVALANAGYAMYCYLVCSSAAFHGGIQLFCLLPLSYAMEKKASQDEPSNDPPEHLHDDLTEKLLDGDEILIDRTHKAKEGKCCQCQKLKEWLDHPYEDKLLFEQSEVAVLDGKTATNYSLQLLTGFYIILPAIAPMLTHMLPGFVAYMLPVGVAFIPLIKCLECFEEELSCCFSLPTVSGWARALMGTAATVAIVFMGVWLASSCVTYAILLYDGYAWVSDFQAHAAVNGPRPTAIMVEWHSHNTSAFLTCMEAKLLHEWGAFTDALALT
jgi:hypothetical protein